MMSVDIGDWSTKSQQTGKSAGESSPDEIAHEVWRQITTELGQPLGEDVNDLQFPQPCWYWIDRFIEFEAGRPVRNAAPYLIPILKDWKNRPGAYPWNPNGTPSRGCPVPGDPRDPREAAGVAGRSRRLPSALRQAGVRRNVDQDVHAHDEHGGGVRVRPPRRQRDPRPLSLRGELGRRQGSPRRSPDLVAHAVRIRGPGPLESDPAPYPGR